MPLALMLDEFLDGRLDDHDQLTTDQAMRNKHREPRVQSMMVEVHNVSNIPNWIIVNQSD